MVKDKSTLTNEVVKEQYEEMISRINVMNKVSKRNIEALGKVEFSARINFSVDGDYYSRSYLNF
jgi:hypothetical protein